MCAKPEFNDFISFALRGLKFPFAGYAAAALSTTLRSAPVCALTGVGPVKQVADNTAAAMNGVAFCMTNGTLRPAPFSAYSRSDTAAKCPK